MQDRYAGDIGDFSKFALLRELAGHDLRLGIVWYLNTAEEQNRDGSLTCYLRVREHAPDLYDCLTGLVRSKARSVARLEQAGVLPLETLYYGIPLPSDRARSVFPQDREEWLRGALTAVHDADLVYLDPDNGLAPPHVTKSSLRSVKYSFLDEVKAFVAQEQSVVLYQHHTRRLLKDVISERLKTFRCIASSWAVSFHTQSTRIYFVLANPRHQCVLKARSAEFLRGHWCADGCFRVHGLT